MGKNKNKKKKNNNKKTQKALGILQQERQKKEEGQFAIWRNAVKLQKFHKNQVYLEKASFLPTANDLRIFALDLATLIKEKERECIFNSKVKIIDLSLKLRGGEEDEAFALLPELQLNFRRGNTIIQLRNQDQVEKAVIGRKGLNKFFDLQLHYVKSEGEDKVYPSKADLSLRNYILADAWKATCEGKQVEIVKTLKANGENAQISWNPDFATWVIASKNVALLAQNFEQSKQYDKEKFQFVKLIAEVWFQKLSELSEQEIECLKNDIQNCTLVGEYVGNQNYQHLIKYDKLTIVFYAVVDNYSRQLCWPCERSFALFEKFKLDKVNISSIGVCNSYPELCEKLSEVFLQVSSSDLANDEEGSVLYLIERNKLTAVQDRVLSLCKLKTLEYRALRKMREKIKNYLSNQNTNKAKSPEWHVSQYMKELQQLLKDTNSTLSKGLGYYKRLFEASFKFIESKEIEQLKIQQGFINFTEELIQYCQEKGLLDDKYQDSFDKEYSGDLEELKQNVGPYQEELKEELKSQSLIQNAGQFQLESKEEGKDEEEKQSYNKEMSQNAIENQTTKSIKMSKSQKKKAAKKQKQRDQQAENERKLLEKEEID